MDPANTNGPCTITRAYAAASGGDTFLIQVPQADGTVKLNAPTSLTIFVTFGTHVKGKAGPVAGTIRFRSSFNIGTPNGQFKTHEKVMVEFDHVEVLGEHTAKAADHYTCLRVPDFGGHIAHRGLGA